MVASRSSGVIDSSPVSPLRCRMSRALSSTPVEKYCRIFRWSETRAACQYRALLVVPPGSEGETQAKRFGVVLIVTGGRSAGRVGGVAVFVVEDDPEFVVVDCEAGGFGGVVEAVGGEDGAVGLDPEHRAVLLGQDPGSSVVVSDTCRQCFGLMWPLGHMPLR